MADANGDPTEPENSFDSFFDDAEYFSHLEVGWIASFKQRYTDSIHLTAWHADAREKEQVASGWGLAFSFNRLFRDKWEPFVRAGYADGGGALWDRSVCIGIGYNFPEKRDLVALGLCWARPSKNIFGSGLDDQNTVELFYRLHLSKVLTITPDVQILIDPAHNPEEDVIFIFGVRVRLSF